MCSEITDNYIVNTFYRGKMSVNTSLPGIVMGLCSFTKSQTLHVRNSTQLLRGKHEGTIK